MKNFINVVFAFMLSVVLSANTVFAEESQPIHLKRVDAFSIVVDQSGSMYMKSNCTKENKENKMVIAKKAVLNVIDSIPSMTYDMRMAMSSEDKLIMPYQEYDKNLLAESVNTIKNEKEIFGRLTPLWTSIKTESLTVGKDYRKTAIIIVTDGDYNRGENPVETVKALYASNPNCIVHIIECADTENGEKTIAEIAKLNQNSVVYSACELANDISVAQEFAKKVFYGEYVPVVINFDFDRYNIKESEVEKINSVKNTELLYDTIKVEGWTDYIGTDAYNMKLSEKRALSVSKALNASEYHGNGKSYTYDNKTDEGRAMNRRAEIIME